MAGNLTLQITDSTSLTIVATLGIDLTDYVADCKLKYGFDDLATLSCTITDEPTGELTIVLDPSDRALITEPSTFYAIQTELTYRVGNTPLRIQIWHVAGTDVFTGIWLELEGVDGTTTVWDGVAKIGPDIEFHYNVTSGLLEQLEYADGRTKNFTYDVDENLVTIVLIDGTTTVTTTLTYDVDGILTDKATVVS